MKKSVLLALFVAFTANLMAQSVAIGESFSNIWIKRLGINGTPLGQDADNVYFFIHTRTSDSFKPKTWIDHLVTVDKNTMKSSDIPITVSVRHYFLNGIASDNNCIALYRSLNNKGDQVIFTIAEIDKSAKSLTLSDNNSVSTTANPKFWPEFKSAKSPDGKMIAALVMVTGKNYQLENLFAVVVNDQGEFVWSSPVTPQFGGKTFSLGNLTVDNEGNIYIPAYTCQMKGDNVSDVKFMMIRTNGDGTESFTENVNFGTPQNFTAKILKDGNIVIGGYFTDLKTNTATQSSGYFFYKFDKNSESFSDLHHANFTDGYKEKEKWARYASVLGNQQYSISADDIYELENGTLVLCGEHRFMKETYSAQMNSYSYGQYTKNILVSKLLPDGSSQFTMIEKQQLGGSGMHPVDDWKVINISYSSFVKGNDMYFLFNDDPSNIPYPGKGTVARPGAGMSFKKNCESVLMRLSPDMELTQRVLPDPNQTLRGVEFTDDENFYASGLGKKDFFLTKYSINE